MTRSSNRRFGIEVEYMIVDRETLAVLPIADLLLRDAARTDAFTTEARRGDIGWSNELALHLIEFKTASPRTSLAGIGEELHESVLAALTLLSPHGALLLPTGAHPTMDPTTEARLWPHGDGEIYAAYDRIFDCRTHGWTNLQSVHLNLSFEGEEDFGRLHAAVRLVLPLIPALAASSPVLDGRPTGFKDNRLEVYRRNQAQVPSITGRVVPEAAFTQAEYQAAILDPIAREMERFDPEGILEPEWLNSRGAIARFDRGSIEIRLIDTQECPAADIGVAAAVDSVVDALANEALSGRPVQAALDEGRLEAILRDTIRDAEETLIAEPEYLAALGRPPSAVTAGALWQSLLEAHSPSTAGEAVDALLRGGTLASRIMGRLGEAPDPIAIRKIWRELADCLAENRMLED